MMKRVFVLLGILLILSLTALGQDPTKIAPEAYKLEFESKPVEGDRKETTHAHPKE
jgi:hypothetical protein